ncbi:MULTISPECIES: hypothetical protein [unclassified Amycolatopsis]|uniref:hypothetical protein n=1 Tax=unclassified Amycolatopsis TaxID=2618356 RepID=UPI001A8F3BAA|nr:MULTISPECIES: hypothetical protein [unclassified Amycolatopsis]HET6707320.1 hypothetical protein [Amycolatopsis sp.]
MKTDDAAVPAHQLTKGQWFWHEPAPGLPAWQLQVNSAELLEDSVEIFTTDEERELVSYPRNRLVRLAEVA